MTKRLISAISAATLLLSGAVFAQNDAQNEAPVIITSPAAWSTLRSDSVTISIQADTAALTGSSINLRVSRRSGNRTTQLFTRAVKPGDTSAEVFLGRVRDIPLGGTDYLSIEWSVPGTEFKGTVEPVGIARLNGVVADNKWVPARPARSAIRLPDTIPCLDAAVASLLASENAFEVSGVKFSAGWNKDGLFIMLTPPKQGAVEAVFALDLKCGKNAFLSWADRFIKFTMDASGHNVSGLHYGNRAVGAGGITFEERPWGNHGTLNISMSRGEPANTSRLLRVRWDELGMQAFEERNIGFSVFVTNQGRRQAVSYPSNAVRNIPGTWGNMKLLK